MKVSIEKGELVIRCELAVEPAPSSTGKTLLVASSRGPYHSGVKLPGTDKEITVSFNATVKP